MNAFPTIELFLNGDTPRETPMGHWFSMHAAWGGKAFANAFHCNTRFQWDRNKLNLIISKQVLFYKLPIARN